MALVTGDKYSAGQWKKGLLQGLSWFRPTLIKKYDLKRLSLTLEQTHVGPSWSWINGYVDFQFFSSGQCGTSDNNPAYETEADVLSKCQFIQASCTLESQNLNPYGRITAGKLDVRGKLVKPCSDWTWAYFKWKVTYDGYAAFCDIDWSIKDGTKSMEVDDVYMLLIASSYGPNSVYELWDEPVRDESDPTDQDRDDQLSGERARKCKISSDRNAWGLLIQPIDHGARYIRVGRFRSGPKWGGLLPFADRPFEEVEIV